jgi:DNA-binding transcriptional LysR family regulator
VLDDLKNLVSQINDEKSIAAHLIRIGSFEVFTTHFLKPLLKTFPQDASLLLREVIPGEMESALLADEIDVGITYIPVPTAGVDHLKIASVKMGIYAKHGMFDRLPFPEVPFAVPVQPLKGTPNKVQGLDGWPDGKVARNVKYQVTLMESALELCRNGLAAAYLPSFVAHLHNQSVKTELRLREYPLPKGIGTHSQAVYIARRKEDPEDCRIKQIARVLREACSYS